MYYKLQRRRIQPDIFDGAFWALVWKKFYHRFNYSRKKPALEPPFNKVTDLKASNFIKKILQHGFSFEICEIFKNTYFEEHLETAASKRKTYCYLQWRRYYLWLCTHFFCFIIAWISLLNGNIITWSLCSPIKNSKN